MKIKLAIMFIHWGWKLLGVRVQVGVMILPDGRKVEF